ncbi:hypothetical protein HHI36_000914, partial [Cryptolaemus montrouzieri]
MEHNGVIASNRDEIAEILADTDESHSNNSKYNDNFINTKNLMESEEPIILESDDPLNSKITRLELDECLNDIPCVFSNTYPKTANCFFLNFSMIYGLSEPFRTSG